MGTDFQGSHDDGGGDRPLGASQCDPGVECGELSAGIGEAPEERYVGGVHSSRDGLGGTNRNRESAGAAKSRLTRQIRQISRGPHGGPSFPYGRREVLQKNVVVAKENG